MSRSSLSGLSDKELLSQVATLVKKERTTTLEIVPLLDEIERRRLYLALGYGSIWDYCTRHLKYSSSSAARRIHTARVIGRFPEVRGLLETGEVNLSTVLLVSDVLREENKDELLGRIRGKSQREVDAIVAGYKPAVALGDRVKAVRVVVPVGECGTPEPPGSGEISQNPCNSLNLHSRCGSTAASSSGGPSVSTAVTQALRQPSTAGGSAAGPSVSTSAMQALRQPGTQPPTPAPNTPTTVRLERRFQVQFLASEAFMKKLDKARSLLSNRLDERSFEKLFEALIDEFLDRHSPERKQERREKRSAKGQGSQKARRKTADTASDKTRDNATGDTHPRHIPEAVRREVHVRDQGRCTYVGTTGERCSSTHHLEIHHVIPYGRGGRSTPGNLRLLCGKHNRLEAERVYGTNAMRCYRPRE